MKVQLTADAVFMKMKIDGNMEIWKAKNITTQAAKITLLTTSCRKMQTSPTCCHLSLSQAVSATQRNALCLIISLNNGLESKSGRMPVRVAVIRLSGFALFFVRQSERQ